MNEINPNASTILVTGAAGFIGFHVAKKLLNLGYTVIGLDNINSYYDPLLKINRLGELGINKSKINWNIPVLSETTDKFSFVRVNIQNKIELQRVYQHFNPNLVCHLAAQAGVRHSLKFPEEYIESNIVGFLNILECCRNHDVEHLTYASSSSVYGLNEKMPLSESDNVDHPISLYAASKKANELMAHSYSHLYNIPTSGLRFFTVYGPWGRPDMALFLFTKAILENRRIDIYNHGDMFRDFTYIDDIVQGIIGVLLNPSKGNIEWSGLKPDPSSSKSPYRVFNIGNNKPIRLMDFINEIEQALGKKAEKEFLPMQPGDIEVTNADISSLKKAINYLPKTGIQEGIRNFIQWYSSYYKVT